VIDHSCAYSSIAQLLRCWTNAAADLPAQTGNDLVGRIWCLCSRHLQTRWVSARHRPLDTAEPIFVTPFLQCPRHRVSLLTTYTRCAHHAALITLRTSKNILCSMHCVLLLLMTGITMHACMHACLSRMPGGLNASSAALAWVLRWSSQQLAATPLHEAMQWHDTLQSHASRDLPWRVAVGAHSSAVNTAASRIDDSEL
jgi:hypothetical protein